MNRLSIFGTIIGMPLRADKLAALMRTHGTVPMVLAEELQAAWRAASEEEARALRAWCASEGTYETFLAALDREEAAAYLLASCLRQSP